MQGELSYHEFKVYMIRILQEEFENEGKLNVSTVTKNNNLRLDAVSWVRGDNNCSPVVYLNDLYDIYRNGARLTQISDNVIQVMRDHADDFRGGSLDWIYDFETVKEKLECKVVNLAENRETLKDCPYIEVLDLAITFRVMICSGANARGTFQVNNSLLHRWGITVRELYEWCRKSMDASWKPLLIPMGEMLDMMIRNNPELEEEGISFEGQVSEDLYVLTNEQQQNGAVLAFCSDVLKHFAGECGMDLLILPSSIHEVLVIPAGNAISVPELQQIVKEVNRECVTREEFLSDHVYRYQRSRDAFVIEV